jgi:arginine/lysine/ornithine decarboxylase
LAGPAFAGPNRWAIVSGISGLLRASRAAEQNGRFPPTAEWHHIGGDGKELFFLDPTDNLVTVDVDPSGNAVRFGVPRRLFQAAGIQRQAGSYVATRDGKKFLIDKGNLKEGSQPLTLVLNWPAELKK